jgi:tetratricopeptide (TPR) repeat protein
MRMLYLLWILIGILSITVPAGKCYSSEHNSAEPDIQFAEYLFEREDFYQAILEYKRFVFRHPDSTLINYANYKIGLCYKNGKKDKLAQRFFEKVLDNNPKDGLREETYLVLAQSYIDGGDFEAARFELDELMEYPHSKGEISSEIHYWKGITYLCEYKWELAQREFDQVIEGRRVRIAKGLQPYLETTLHLPYRSKKKAVLLSTFLPGSGQIYCGRIIDGITSFVFNGTLLYFTGKKIDSEDYLSAGLIFIFGVMRFYNGNRENAHRAADEYNERINSRILKETKALWEER